MRKSCLQHKSHRGLSLLTGVHSQGSTNPHASSSVFVCYWCTAADTQKAQRQSRCIFNWNSVTCRCDLCESVCKALIWFLSYRTECHIHHFHVRQRIWKAHFQGYGWSHFKSVVHWQYVVSYAYSRYVNVFLRKKKRESITAGCSIPGEHTGSAPGFAAPLFAAYSFPWLLTLLQHCCASRCSSSSANSYNFRILGKLFFRGRAAKWRETTKTASLLGPV